MMGEMSKEPGLPMTVTRTKLTLPRKVDIEVERYGDREEVYIDGVQMYDAAPGSKLVSNLLASDDPERTLRILIELAEDSAYNQGRSDAW